MCSGNEQAFSFSGHYLTRYSHREAKYFVNMLRDDAELVLPKGQQKPKSFEAFSPAIN